MLVGLGVTRERSRLRSGIVVIEMAIFHEINRTGGGGADLTLPSTTVSRVVYAQMLSLLCESLS